MNEATYEHTTCDYRESAVAGVGVGQARKADQRCCSSRSSHCASSRIPAWEDSRPKDLCLT